MKKYLLLLITFLIWIWISLFSCKSIERTQPEYPAVESLQLDLSYYVYNQDSVSYYNDAANKLVIWQKLINDSMNFQRSLYDEAATGDLQFQNNDTWIGTKTLVIDGITYSINLFEIVDSDTLNTKMFVTKIVDSDTLFNNVLLLDGISYPDQSGSWFVNQNDTADTYIKLQTIDYKLINNSIKSIKFTFNQQGNFNGNTLYFRDSVDGVYNSYIELYDKISENITVIQWNNSTYNGKIKDENLYGDSDWRCWDENFLNSDCN